MIERDCTICHGLGWVCENHAKTAWSKLGCQCGAGMRCECRNEDVIIVEFVLEETKH